jgi:hypothetical protein
MFEMHEATFEIYAEDNLINKQAMQAPKEILMANFMQIVNQIGNDSRPMKIKMIKPTIIWDRFEEKEKTLDTNAEFKNNAMIAWEDSKKGV